ncbi:PQQ-binding-like beta-propeller repeat protein [Chondromyces crocatus]|uniref:Pyrrolo-quinoline quinone repeat domain-containing protein n=1 Tax=Chondromyces crocatus TaxID=52 RepID=A0A0K1EGC6_CHOCO|nr:PQQ-binding-like beta-propeller repeat protein [Chondromyces crocatus]AKT39926.1 uncharacterized protein CMC5_040770 [Chondromyces crocatus]
MPLLPDADADRRAYDAARSAVLAGAEDPDVRFAGDPFSLSAWLRVRKLIEAVGDTARVLHHVGLDPARWADLERRWIGLLHQPSVRARHDLWSERLDVRTEAAQLLSSPGPVSRDALEPGATILTAPDSPTSASAPRRAWWALGYALRGAAPPALRAVDLATGQVVWEGLTSLCTWHSPPARGSYAARGRALFFAHETRIGLADLATGTLHWAASLPAPIAHDDEGRVALFDPLPEPPHATRGGPPSAANSAGVVLVRTQTPALIALDRESGNVRWQIPLGSSARLHEVTGLGVLVHARDVTGQWVSLLDPWTGAARWTIGGRLADATPQVEAVTVRGRHALLLLTEGTSTPPWPPLGPGVFPGGAPLPGGAQPPQPPVGSGTFSGSPALPQPPARADRSVLRIDVLTGQPIGPPVRADVQARPAPATLERHHVWAGAAAGTLVRITDRPPPGLVDRLLGRRVDDTTTIALPEPDLLVDALEPAGALVLALVHARGERRVRLLALDPSIGALRWDTRDLGPTPDSPAGAALRIHGTLAAVATGTTPDGPTQITGIDAERGVPRWSLAITGWTGHDLLGDALIVWSREHAQIVRIADGTALGFWPLVER